MNTLFRSSRSLRMLQNCLFREATTQAGWARIASAHIHTRCVFDVRNAQNKSIFSGARSEVTPMMGKVQNITCLLPSRPLSMSAVRSILSKSSSNAPPDNTLIYTGPLSNMVKMVKLFSLSTSGLSLLILQLLYMSSESGAMKVLGGSMACMLFLTPLALHWISKSYVTKMCFNPETDTFSSYTVTFLLTSRRQDFKPEDVQIPAVRNLMTSIVVKGRPLLIDPRAFENPNHYSHLMGYDKLPEGISMEDIQNAIGDLSDEEEQQKTK